MEGMGANHTQVELREPCTAHFVWATEVVDCVHHSLLGQLNEKTNGGCNFPPTVIGERLCRSDIYPQSFPSARPERDFRRGLVFQAQLGNLCALGLGSHNHGALQA